MTDTGISSLDRERIRELFDLRNNLNLNAGGFYTDDPYPVWHELRAKAAVHEGTVHELTGCPGDPMFHGLPFPERPHFSTFSYEVCDAAYRNPAVFASSPDAADGSPDDVGFAQSMLMMGGTKHRRYRTLVQPSFVPAKAQWWIDNWIQETVDALVDGLAGEGRAELNVDFCAAIPVLTITGSFGVPVEEALDIRAALADPMSVVERLAPIVAARREKPGDDLISVLVEAEITEEDGSTAPPLGPRDLLLCDAAAHGRFWHDVEADGNHSRRAPRSSSPSRRHPSGPDAAQGGDRRVRPLDAHRPDVLPLGRRGHRLLRCAAAEGVGAALCIGAASRDPARWDNPDAYDPARPLKPALGFGSGPHVCLGMHVARAEMSVGISALLDRLPNLRLDAEADPPSPVGFYERGVMEIPVVFD